VKTILLIMRNFRVFMLIAMLVPVGLAGNANGQTFTSLHSFTGGSTDGAFPEAGLVQGTDGNFYGTTAGFANLGSVSFGATTGTIYRITSNGTFTNLYSFTGGSDGGNPQAALIQGFDGNFYGTTAGFANLGSASFNSSTGTVFRISSSGFFTNLYSFTGSYGTSDGANPHAALVQGTDSNFYGTTWAGGSNGVGTVFRISSNGNLTNLYSFTGGSDGNTPQAGLVQGFDGSFYGTTVYGGDFGGGNVYRITSLGIPTNLYSFTFGSDGYYPQAGLVQGSNSNFYGTILNGGDAGWGTVFWISSSGTLSTIYPFTGGNDGGAPDAGLIRGSDGSFYGTTLYGGAYGSGTVFGITSSGVFTNLYSFTGGSDGGFPQAALVQGRDGNFYGTTVYGGLYGSGTVFKVAANIGPLQFNSILRVGNDIRLSWQWPWSGVTQLQRSSGDAAGNYTNSWTNIAPVVSVGPYTNFTDIGAAGNHSRFYRVRMTPITP